MRTIEQLKQAGFAFVASERGEGCTDIRNTHPFWYYNANFYERMDEVHESLRPAESDAQGFVLTVAGTQWLQGDRGFPFNLLDAERKAHLDDARSRYVTARNDAQRAQDDYLDALRTDKAYMA